MRDAPGSAHPVGAADHIGSSSWEADIILNDGTIATIRAAVEDDRPGLEAFYDRVSERSKTLRFFGVHPRLTDEDFARWFVNDGTTCATLVLEERDLIIAVAGYTLIPEYLPARVGNVSFLVQDSHHNKGVGPIMLEHLAHIGRENGVERFFAEMLTTNKDMMQVFRSAGYSVEHELSDGMITVDFPITPNATSREVMQRRETRAEANSLRGILSPRRVALVGKEAQALARPEEFQGEFIYVDDAQALLARGDSAEDGVDLVVSIFDAQQLRLLRDAAVQCGARAAILVTLSQNPGFDADRAAEVVHIARSSGLRVLGPSSLGIINTDPGVQLNLTTTPVSSGEQIPSPGTVGIFAQSAGIATLLLSQVVRRGIGVSSFVASGTFADITGNDVMQYWSDDDRTEVCVLSLDSVGNPRKFFRVISRLALDKHVVVLLPSSSEIITTIVELTGAIVLTRRSTMLDVAQLLTSGPLPREGKVAVISNSVGVTQQMERAAKRLGLETLPVVVSDPPAHGIPRAARVAAGDPDVGAVVCTIVEIGTQIAEDTLSGLADVIHADTTDIPIVATRIGFELSPEASSSVPEFGTFLDALEALAIVADAEKRRAAARPQPEDEVGRGGEDAANAIVADILTEEPAGRWATDSEAATILSAYGIDIIPWVDAPAFDSACTAAKNFQWDVVLKATCASLRGRTDLPTATRATSTEELRAAWEQLGTLARELGLGDDASALDPAVQKRVPAGTSLTIRSQEDPVIGPIVGAGIAGVPSNLLGDVAWRVPPLRRQDASAMLDSLKAAPLLHGYGGTSPVLVEGIEHILMQLSRLNDDIPAIVEVELTPVIASPDSVNVTGGRVRVAPLNSERDPTVRSLQ